MNTQARAYIKQLRTDAKKLETVAKHLRQMARDEAHSQKLIEAKPRATFFHKETKADPNISFEQEQEPESEHDFFENTFLRK